MRSRDYLITYRGHKFSPLHPDASEIDILDIAHALARMGRANGHFEEFYSVGQHCLDCAREALERGCGARQAMVCLLHDASEAYMADITSPVKRFLRQYMGMEDNLLDVIYEKYIPGGIRPKEQRIMKEIDNAMLYYEFVSLKGERLVAEAPQMLIDPCFEFRGFRQVEEDYLQMFDRLRREMRVQPEQTAWITAGITHHGDSWQAVMLENGTCTCHSAGTLWELLQICKEADAVLTDLPVGLPENKEDETARAEGNLRKAVNGGSIAVIPCRQAVYAATDFKAREENFRVLGRTITPQQLQQRAVLREVDETILSHNEWKNVLRQSHPQLLGSSRRMILQQYAGSISRGMEDAMCLAMLGQLECRNGSVTIPEHPESDAKGLRMQMIAPKF